MSGKITKTVASSVTKQGSISISPNDYDKWREIALGIAKKHNPAFTSGWVAGYKAFQDTMEFRVAGETYIPTYSNQGLVYVSPTPGGYVSIHFNQKSNGRPWSLNIAKVGGTTPAGGYPPAVGTLAWRLETSGAASGTLTGTATLSEWWKYSGGNHEITIPFLLIQPRTQTQYRNAAITTVTKTITTTNSGYTGSKRGWANANFPAPGAGEEYVRVVRGPWINNGACYGSASLHGFGPHSAPYVSAQRTTGSSCGNTNFTAALEVEMRITKYTAWHDTQAAADAEFTGTSSTQTVNIPGKTLVKITRDRDGKVINLKPAPLMYRTSRNGVLMKGSESLGIEAQALQMVADGSGRPRRVSIFGIPNCYSYHERDTGSNNPGNAKPALNKNLPFKNGYNTIEVTVGSKGSNLTSAGGVGHGYGTFKKVGSKVFHSSGWEVTSSWRMYANWDGGGIWSQHWVRKNSDGTLSFRAGGGQNRRYGATMITSIEYSWT